MRNVDALPTRPAPVVHAPTRARQWRGLPDLWHFAAEYLLLLPLGAAIALVWANAYPESYFRSVFALDFFVNDVAMVLFFGFVTKEIVEATVPGGILHPWRRAALPLAGAAGMLRRGNMRSSDQTAASFDQDQSFMLIEVAGDDMFFESISRTGRIVDSGVINRQRRPTN